MDVELFKKGKKVICYIKHYEDKHIVCTGKPSDATCIGWTYSNKEEAANTAKEYFQNRTQMFN